MATVPSSVARTLQRAGRTIVGGRVPLLRRCPLALCDHTVLTACWSTAERSFSSDATHALHRQASFHPTPGSSSTALLGVSQQEVVEDAATPWLAADLEEVPSMGSREVRRLAQAGAAVLEERGASAIDEQLWSEIASRCLALGQTMDPWDVIFVLQAFTAAGAGDRGFYMGMAEIAASKASKLAPKRILDLFAVYEANELRPRSLYVELFHTVIRLASSMYPEEVTLTLQALARYHIGNPTVVAILARSASQQLSDMRLRYLCGVVGALGSMKAIPQRLLVEFDERARMEVETIPVQELLDNVMAFPRLEFSWKPYEELCMTTFIQQVNAFEDHRDVDQLKDPFEAMHFLQAKNVLSASFLEALVQWSLVTVHRPNVLSERRPTAGQLVLLHDRCSQHGISAEADRALHDAISYYVESGGGQWPAFQPQPLKYKARRCYIIKADPLEESKHPAYVPAPDPDQPPYHAVALGTSRVQLADSPEAPLPPKLHAQIAVGPRKVPTKKRVTSRKGPRGEARKDYLMHPEIRDPGMPRYKTPNRTRLPLHIQGGFTMRPKYTPGRAHPRYPWAGVPAGAKGPAWSMRR